MTTAEKIYTAIVIACGGIFLLPLFVFHFMLIPKSSDPYALYLVTAIMWTIVITIAITSTINLRYGSLVIIPTILQCLAVSAMLYLLPIGIWGGYLLYHRIQRSKLAAVVPTVPTSSIS